MKKYLKMIPVMVYPYAYLLVILIFGITLGAGDEVMRSSAGVLKYIAIIFNLYSLFIVIYNTALMATGKYTLRQSTNMNLIIKILHIPIHMFHFVLGVIGILMGIWGIMFTILALTVSTLAIVLTGINSIGCSVRMYKDGVLKKSHSIICGILSFVFCVDIVVAIIYFIKARRKPINSATAQ